MKIIQSFWTKPFLHLSVGETDSRFNGGWLEVKYYFMSWAFSCLQLLKYYGNVELITDTRGKQLLIDSLGLPYTCVVNVLDRLNYYHPMLWALGKIFSYRIQREPFLHVDSDVFIWEPFSDKIEKSDLIVQHGEFGYAFYTRVYEDLRRANAYIPDCIVKYHQERNSIDAYNLGIVGGNCNRFFEIYADAAFEFVEKNRPQFDKISLGSFNPFYEQVLLYCLAIREGIPIKPFLKVIDQDDADKMIKGIGSFIAAPRVRKFIHLYADSKLSLIHCRELEKKLSESYPIYYRRVVDLSASLSAAGIFK
jgi:hypothetical protein